MPCGSSEISLWFEIPLQGKGTPDRMAKPMNLFITSHQRRRSPCIKVSHSIFLVNYIFMLFNMDDWLQDHMVKTHCSGHRVDAGSGTDTAHAAAGTSPCLPRCCQPQTLKRPLKKHPRNRRGSGDVCMPGKRTSQSVLLLNISAGRDSVPGPQVSRLHRSSRNSLAAAPVSRRPWPSAHGASRIRSGDESRPA